MKPYNEYAANVVEGLEPSEIIETYVDDKVVGESRVFNLEERNLRNLIVDAWMDGLKYSLVMIESEKRRRDDSQD